jgi:hypothetical protein
MKVATIDKPTSKRSQGDSSKPGRRQFHRIAVLLCHYEEDGWKSSRNENLLPLPDYRNVRQNVSGGEILG